MASQTGLSYLLSTQVSESLSSPFQLIWKKGRRVKKPCNCLWTHRARVVHGKSADLLWISGLAGLGVCKVGWIRDVTSCRGSAVICRRKSFRHETRERSCKSQSRVLEGHQQCQYMQVQCVVSFLGTFALDKTIIAASQLRQVNVPVRIFILRCFCY